MENISGMTNTKISNHLLRNIKEEFALSLLTLLLMDTTPTWKLKTGDGNHD